MVPGSVPYDAARPSHFTYAEFRGLYPMVHGGQGLITANGVLDAYEPYINRFGLVNQYPDTVDGNGIRYTADMIFAVERFKGLNESINWSRVKGWMESCELEPGLLSRAPDNSGGQQQLDDVVGMIAVSTIIGSDFPKRFIKYGEDHFWFFDTDGKMELKDFFGRQLQVIAHAKFALNEKPSLITRLAWMISVLISAFSKDQDGKVLSWHLVKTANAKDRYCDLVAYLWRMMLKRHYPNGIGQVLEAYGWVGHPAAFYLRDEFG